MVSIISPPKQLHTSCGNCKAELAYLKTEVQSYEKRDYTGDADKYHYIVCPACHQNVIVHVGWYF